MLEFIEVARLDQNPPGTVMVATVAGKEMHFQDHLSAKESKKLTN
jgi:hypothetical protein